MVRQKFLINIFNHKYSICSNESEFERMSNLEYRSYLYEFWRILWTILDLNLEQLLAMAFSKLYLMICLFHYVSFPIKMHLECYQYFFIMPMWDDNGLLYKLITWTWPTPSIQLNFDIQLGIIVYITLNVISFFWAMNFHSNREVGKINPSSRKTNHENKV